MPFVSERVSRCASCRQLCAVESSEWKGHGQVVICAPSGGEVRAAATGGSYGAIAYCERRSGGGAGIRDAVSNRPTRGAMALSNYRQGTLSLCAARMLRVERSTGRTASRYTGAESVALLKARVVTVSRMEDSSHRRSRFGGAQNGASVGAPGRYVYFLRLDCVENLGL